MDVNNSIISSALLLLFVIDPFGNVPILLSVLKDVPADKRRRIIIRETLIGLCIMLIFLFFGRFILELFHLQTEAITIAGGIILFIVGIRLIFPDENGAAIYGGSGEPLVVPIALPMIAGPSTLATLMVLHQQQAERLFELTLAVLLAWGIMALALLSAPMLYKVLKDKGLQAVERLMGMLLLIMAVQMFINGTTGLVQAM